MDTPTKHTCNRGRGPAFGRDAEAFEGAAIRAHDCAVTGCGRVCTFGQW